MLCIVGGLFGSSIGIPAGWLLSSIIIGVLWGIINGGLSFSGIPFKVALAYVATSIGLRLDIHIIMLLRNMLLPLLITIVLTIAGGYFLGYLLNKKSDVDQMTAFFCCIPGGASEIIGISREFGADDRIVAAFHTVRITFFVLFIPFIVGYINTGPRQEVIQSIAGLELSHLLFFPLVILLTLFLDSKLHIPGGALLFSILISFLLSSFMMEIPTPPAYIPGIGQALIGGMVGVRFDKSVLVRLLGVGKITMMIMIIFFGISLLTSTLFHFMTKLSFSVSLIGTVPAGAAEMAATAIALDLSPTIVASLHIIRIILLFLTLPLLIKIFKFINREKNV